MAVEDVGQEHIEAVIGEEDNIRAALEWSLSAGEIELGLRLAVALEHYSVVRNLDEGVRVFQRLLAADRGAPLVLSARALRVLAGNSFLNSDYPGPGRTQTPAGVLAGRPARSARQNPGPSAVALHQRRNLGTGTAPGPRHSLQIVTALDGSVFVFVGLVACLPFPGAPGPPRTPAATAHQRKDQS